MTCLAVFRSLFVPKLWPLFHRHRPRHRSSHLILQTGSPAENSNPFAPNDCKPANSYAKIRNKTNKKCWQTSKWIGGRNSSVGSAWARCPQRRGFDPPLGKFSRRGDFSLGVNMGSNSIPQKTLSDKSINRGLVCAHMHFIPRTQKILTFIS